MDVPAIDSRIRDPLVPTIDQLATLGHELNRDFKPHRMLKGTLALKEAIGNEILSHLCNVISATIFA